MTVPDPTVPTAEDVIVEALTEHALLPWGGCNCGEDWDSVTWTREHQVAAVVAAVRGMTVEQQAELIGGEVQRSGRTHLGDDGLFEHEPVARLVGPWRAEP